MKTHGRSTLPLPSLFFLLLAFPLPACTPATQGGQDQVARIESVENGLSPAIRLEGREPEKSSVYERMERFNVPGVSVAVLDGGDIAWAKGYGVKEVGKDDPVTAETLFQAASISKPVAAMAALKLVEEGLLELDAPVNVYLESWKLPENEFTSNARVTLRHLITHTGGLTVHGFPGYALDAPVATTVQVLDGSGPANTEPIRVDTFPGSLWRYSGGGYTIMQLLLEDVTGKPFPQILREYVLDPAGMSLSSYEQPLPPERAVYAATAHLSDGTVGDGSWHLYPEMAAAGLWTNPTELARLALHVQAGYRGEPGRVLSPQMTREQLTPGMGSWGLGFVLEGEGEAATFSHGGSNYGFKANFMAFVEGGRGVFVMTNGDRGSALAEEITLAVAAEYGWPEPQYREVPSEELSAEELQEIAGAYRIQEPPVEVQVWVEGNHLRLEGRDPEENTSVVVMTLHATARDLFIDLSSGTRVRVERNEDGAVVALQQMGGPRASRIDR
jgi:CubicO group peptidase (beta-lactamase class C family)